VDNGPAVEDLRAGIARLGPTNPDWTEPAVLASAAASFKRPVVFLEELTAHEIGQILAAMPADPDDDIPFA
jgi:hypothetical protein